MNLKKQLISQSIISLLIKACSMILLFAISILLTRTLGPEGFGIYSFILSVLVIISIPLQAGIPQLSLRESARAISKNQNYKVIQLWKWISKRILLLFLVVFILSSLILMLFFNTKGLYEKVFSIGFISILLFSLMLSQSYMLRGIGKNILGLLPDNIIYPLSLCIILLIFIHTSPVLDAESAMLLYVISILIAFLFSLVYFYKIKLKIISKNIIDCSDHMYWKSSLYSLSVVGGLQLLYGHLDIVWIGFFCNDSDIGIYKAMLQVSSLIIFGLAAINQILYSHFANLYAQGKMKQLSKLVTISSLIITFLAFVPFLIFISQGEFLINFIFGKEYIGGYTVLIILVMGQFINALFGSVGALLNMTGHEKDSMKGMIYGIMFNIILNTVLIPFWGIVGAAVSSALSLVVWNSILRYYVNKRLGIESIGLLQLSSLINELRR